MSFFTLTPVRAALALALGATLLPAAHATNGYFPHGFGIKAQGMGGASIATANDAFAGVNNPAGAVFAGSRMELGVDLFMPDRSMSRTNVPAAFGPAFSASETSGRTNFLIPEFGYNAVLSDKLAVGVSVYGNGGMNSTYPGGNTMCPTGPTTPPAAGLNPLCGQGKLGVDLMQLIVAPTVAYKLAPDHAVGVSPLLVLQRFEAYGTPRLCQPVAKRGGLVQQRQGHQHGHRHPSGLHGQVVRQGVGGRVLFARNQHEPL